MSDQGDEPTPRTPPHNPPAEESLISACLISTKALDHAVTVVTPDDFYAPANRRVFAAMLRLHTDSQPVDIVTVADEIQTDTAPAIVDPARVAGYLTSLGHTAHSTRYADIVARDAWLRRLLRLASELTEAVYAFDDTAIDQALDALGKER